MRTAFYKVLLLLVNRGMSLLVLDVRTYDPTITLGQWFLFRTFVFILAIVENTASHKYVEENCRRIHSAPWLVLEHMRLDATQNSSTDFAANHPS